MKDMRIFALSRQKANLQVAMAFNLKKYKLDSGEPEIFAPEPDITWTHKGLPHILASIPADTKSLVDVGCGRGIIAALARIYRSPT